MDALPPRLVLPQPHVTAGEFDAYVAAADSFGADAAREARREARTWRWGFLGMTVATAAMGVALASIATRHTEHWGLMLADPVTGTVRVIKDLHDTSLNLPASVDDWFMERYVQMREGWNEADADSAFLAVACMSDPVEQKAFEAWYNRARTAPQQVFTKARRGWREVKTTAPPGTEGVSSTGARRVAVPFTWEDKGLGDAAARASGTARFTVRKDLKARQPCNPTGIVISEYTSPLFRENLQ